MIHQLLDTEAKLIICSQDILSKCIQVRKELQREDDLAIVVLDYGDVGDDCEHKIYNFYKLLKEAESLKEEDGPDMKFEGWSINDRASIVWSSGTTGKPKGIQHNFQ